MEYWWYDVVLAVCGRAVLVLDEEHATRRGERCKQKNKILELCCQAQKTLQSTNEEENGRNGVLIL
jgi:hypothetical protein